MYKDIIIFVNAIRPRTFEALKKYEMESGRHFTPIVLVDAAVKELIFACNGQNNLPEPVEVLIADFNSAVSVRNAVKPYEDRIFAVTAQYENCIQELRQLVPYFPYIPMPTEQSLVWATEKKLMRKMLEAYDPTLVPKYIEINDVEAETINKIEAVLSYPVIVKPSGLEGSLLVSYVKDRHELIETLKYTFDTIQKAYDTWVKRQEPTVLVEEFMVGDMHTADVYVDAQGICRLAPVIKSITGRQAGYDDFFCYMETLPADLIEDEIKKAQLAASSACNALGLRSITGHVEMIRTAQGWKIIELGPRIGGWRHEVYEQAYGINHIVNDIRNRAGEVPDIPADLHHHVAVFGIYARQEGVLKAVQGMKELKKLSSFQQLKQTLFEGDTVLFAKNGGDVVLNVLLSHPDEAQLKADIAAMEAAITFEVE